MSWRETDDEKLLLEFAAWLTSRYGLGYLVDVLAKEFMEERERERNLPSSQGV